MKKNWVSPMSVLLLAVVLDQLVKGILLYLLTGSVPAFGNAFGLVDRLYLMARVTDFFNIVFTWNPGTSFSLFRSLGESAPMIIIVLTGAVIGFLGYHLFARSSAGRERIALSLILGGASGNLIDRIRFGAVIDFLDFHAGGWHWPAFNVADICICIGVGLFLLHYLISRKSKNK